MTKKHFEGIAKAIDFGAWQAGATRKSDKELSAISLARTNIAVGIAEVCAETNPNFDRARFLEACGVKS